MIFSKGDLNKGLVIVPTELFPDKGTQLESILLELAHRNELDPLFIDWNEMANTFCNSLMDRTGSPRARFLSDPYGTTWLRRCLTY